MSKAICRYCHEWRSHEWKLLAYRTTSDTNSLFTVKNILLYFLHAISGPEHTIALKQFSIADLAIVAKDGLFWLSIVTSPQLICDVTRTWGTDIVTSYSSIVLARVNWNKSYLH